MSFTRIPGPEPARLAVPQVNIYDAPGSDRPGAPGTHPAFDALVRTIWRLRQEDGCPWDKVQTHESIAKNMIEEAFEAVDAIEGAGQRHLPEELGDVMMQVLLHAQIASDESDWGIDEVCSALNEKLIRRHEHVFGDVRASDDKEALAMWDKVKVREQKASEDAADAAGERREGLLDSVPVALPALMQCQKISRKAASVGFEWDDVDDVWGKVNEEIAEFKAAPAGSDEAVMEFGDILFALVNVARHQHIDAETALRASCTKFRTRWASMEADCEREGGSITDCTRGQLETLWAAAKTKENE